MIRSDDRTRMARAVTVAGALALLALAGCNRNEPPPVRSDAPPASTAPGAAGNAPGSTGMGSGSTVAQDTPGMSGSAVGDTVVTARVKSALLADPLVKGLAIEVETRDGIVSLTGKVSGAAERARAMEITRGIDGVRSVTDGLSSMN
jgi:hyperosmotically inducible protein